MAFITIDGKNYPFDEDIFAEYWLDEPDLVKNALVQSGAMVVDSYIEGLIAGGSNTYTIPFYGALETEDADNYDGETDITIDTYGASSQTGVVYGRTKAWSARQFIADFTQANPMAAIAARTAKFWQTMRQRRTLGILDAVCSQNDMSSHIVTKSAITPTTLTDTAQEVFGDNKSSVALAIMHSAVAQSFEDIQIIDYLKSTDPNGMQREVPIFTVNGIMTLIDDAMPKTAGAEGEGATYTTYLLGQGALHYGGVPVTLPVELHRDPLKGGGTDILINRLRETIHPNGFNFKMGTGANWSASPTDAQLAAKANWSLAFSDPRALPIAKLITPGHEG